MISVCAGVHLGFAQVITCLDVAAVIIREGFSALIACLVAAGLLSVVACSCNLLGRVTCVRSGEHKLFASITLSNQHRKRSNWEGCSLLRVDSASRV
jgi:hypothetical protein